MGSETRAGTSSNTWMEFWSCIKSLRLGSSSSLRLCLGCHGNRALRCHFFSLILALVGSHGHCEAPPPHAARCLIKDGRRCPGGRRRLGTRGTHRRIFGPWSDAAAGCILLITDAESGTDVEAEQRHRRCTCCSLLLRKACFVWLSQCTPVVHVCVFEFSSFYEKTV